MSTLVIRLSSLGDVVLAGAVTGGLAPVHFLTRARYAPVAARLPGVERVLSWEESPSLRGYDRVVDLHASPRSRLASLRALATTRRVDRHDLRRRLRVAFKAGDPPPRVIRRYADAAGVDLAPSPWIDLPGAGQGEALALIPGAAHATKRWPMARWVALGHLWGGPTLVLGGPEERALVQTVSERVGTTARAVVERGFEATFEALSCSRAAVGGDTGLLHLAAACGVPTLGIYGPTTSADGFWCWDVDGEVVELPLYCRPCSLHGGPACPIGDHLCMSGISAEAVFQALSGLLERRGP